MNRAKSLSELKEKFKVDVFGVFDGMDKEYKALINSYNQAKFVQAGTYTSEYLDQLRSETMTKIKELMSNRYAVALHKIESIENDYTPTVEPKLEPSTTEEKILLQLERNNNLLQVQARINSTEDKRTAYKEIYQEFKDDEFVLQYLDNLSYELKDYERNLLKHELDEETKNPFITEINKIKQSLKLLLSPSTTMYPSYLETGIDKEDGSIMTFRTISRDLDLKDSHKEGWKTKWNTPHRN